MQNGGTWPRIITSPSEGLYLEIYAHQIMNYRYHWHEDMYEVSIILHGRARCYAGSHAYDLQEDDLIVIDPLIGHASLALEKDTLAMVLRFSYDYPSRNSRKGTFPLFHQMHSEDATRYDSLSRPIRCYAADIMLAKDAMTAKLNAALLIQHLIANAEHTGKKIPESFRKDDGTDTIIKYINEHYFEKLRLEDLATFTGYNRTYLSSFFHDHVGIGFHDYLSRIRFQNALREIWYTDKPLTDIALGNGFPELKSFTAMFKDVLGFSPSEYIETMRHMELSPTYERRRYLDPAEPLVKGKLEAYSHKGL